MNGIGEEALRFGRACARMYRELQVPLARLRRVEQHQQTMINWLIGADHSPRETTIASSPGPHNGASPFLSRGILFVGIPIAVA